MAKQISGYSSKTATITKGTTLSSITVVAPPNGVASSAPLNGTFIVTLDRGIPTPKENAPKSIKSYLEAEITCLLALTPDGVGVNPRHHNCVNRNLAQKYLLSVKSGVFA